MESWWNISLKQFKIRKINNNLVFNEKKNLQYKGSSFNGIAPSNALIGSWWNHNILNQK